MSAENPWPPRLSTWLFGRLQRLLPRRRWRHRREDARELFETLATRAYRSGGWPALLRVLLGSVIDLARSVPVEHRASRGGAGPLARVRVRLEALGQDVRLAVRGLVQRPLVGTVVVLTLALGIGANVAIFSLVRAVLVRDLPYPEPERIVRFVGERFGEVGRGTITWPNFHDVSRQVDAIGIAAAYDEWQVNVGGLDGDPVRVDAATVTTTFFEVLGVTPALGRFFRPREDMDGSDRVVVLSHGFWRRHFGADPDAVGRTILLDDRPHEVVGVAPARFEDPMLSGAAWGRPALWRPLGYGGVEASRLPSRGSASFTAIGRLAPGVGLESAQSAVDAYYEHLRSDYPEDNDGRALRLVPLHESIVGDVRPTLLLLMAAVLLVLGIAAVNVAGILLGRAAERRREGAIRVALGAGRGRLIQLFVVEGVVLAALGAVLGMGLAGALRGTLLRLLADSLPRAELVALDPVVLAFTTVTSLLTGVVCGLLPAWSYRTRSPVPGLVGGGRTATVGRATRRLRAGLVACEVGLAVTLLVACGLLVRSLWSLQSTDPGFQPEGVLAFELAPSAAAVDGDELVAFYRRLLAGLESIPEVEAAGGVSLLPLSGSFDRNALWDAAAAKPASADMPRGEARTVTPGYFETLGVRLVRGRAILPTDGPEDPPVVVLSETMARRLWPDGRALGRQVTRGGAAATVVGIVEDVRELDLRGEGEAAFYVAHAQRLVSWHTRRMKIVLRAAHGEPSRLAAAARSVVGEMAPGLPLAKIRTMERVAAGAVAAPRARTFLLGTFAAVALLLAAVGIYGIVSFSVVQRRREMAIRMALGAAAGSVVRNAVRSGLAPVAVGTIVGLGAALLASRFLSSMLHEVAPLDPSAYVAAAVVLPSVAALAAWLPARRAASIDLIEMLGED